MGQIIEGFPKRTWPIPGLWLGYLFLQNDLRDGRYEQPSGLQALRQLYEEHPHPRELGALSSIVLIALRGLAAIPK